MVGHALAQQLHSRIVVGPRAFIPASPDDPFAFRDFSGEGDDARNGFFFGLNVCEINAALFFTKPGDVRVRINQTRNHRRALQINHASLRATIFFASRELPTKMIRDPHTAIASASGFRPPMNTAHSSLARHRSRDRPS